jgi:hypothetical protein
MCAIAISSFPARPVRGPRSRRNSKRAARAVEKVLPTLGSDDLFKPYPLSMVPGQDITTALFLQHLCSHAAFHLGQAGYVRRVVTGDARSSSPVSLVEIAKGR